MQYHFTISVFLLPICFPFCNIFTLTNFSVVELTTFENRRDRRFSEGFSNWNDGKRKFEKHESSESHRESVAALNRHSSGRVDDMLSARTKSQKKENTEMLSHVVEAIRYLARQNLALRGATVKKSEENLVCEPNANFWQTLLLIKKYSPSLPLLINRKQNFTSPTIQNELLHIMSRLVLQTLADDIKSAKYYSIMVDETTDCSNSEQAVFCFRLVGG